VVAEHPAYIDCYLRLACMDRARGHHKAALKHAQVGKGRRRGACGEWRVGRLLGLRARLC
jgi:hypothetical protein